MTLPAFSAKKIRCDGLKPRCNNCAEAGEVCTAPGLDGRKNKKRRIAFADTLNPAHHVLPVLPATLIERDAGIDNLFRCLAPGQAAYQPEVSQLGDESLRDFSAFTEMSVDPINVALPAQSTMSQAESTFQLLTQALDLQTGSATNSLRDLQPSDNGSRFVSGLQVQEQPEATTSAVVLPAAANHLMTSVAWHLLESSTNAEAAAASSQLRPFAGGDTQPEQPDATNTHRTSTPLDGSLRLQYLRYVHWSLLRASGS